jgi:hypothetical protein
MEQTAKPAQQARRARPAQPDKQARLVLQVFRVRVV